MRSMRDWLVAFIVVLVLASCGSTPDADAGPLRRGVRAVGRGVRVAGVGAFRVGRFAARRATFPRLRARIASQSNGSCGSGFASGGCEGGACR